MSRKILTLLLALVVLAPTLLLTAPEVRREETLIVDICSGRAPAPYDIWNPFIPGTKRDCGFHQLCMEPLFIVNLATGEYIPWLAESYEYGPDFKTLVVHLRRGVKWSDGHPFTADDVVFTYELLLKYAPKLLWSAAVKKWVEEVRKIDDYTVEFVLKAPNPRFHLTGGVFPVCRIWGGVPIVPKHIWEGKDPLKFKNYPPVGTGPYRLVSASETAFVWERRDDWWGTELFGVRPAPKRVIFTAYGPPETKAMKMANHELDQVFMLLPSLFLSVKERNPYVSSWFKGPPYAWLDPCPRHLFINHMVYPYNITEVRRAISYMINRTEIVRVALENGTMETWSPFPYYGALKPYLDAIKDLVEKYEPAKYNPKKAEEILRGLGFKKGPDGIWILPNGKRWEAVLITREWDADCVAAAPIVARQLREAGIDIVWKAMPRAAYYDMLNTGRYDMAIMISCPGDTDPYELLEHYHSKFWRPIGESSGLNQVRYRNPEYDKLVEELGRTPPSDVKKCTELFRKIMEIYFKDVITVPLFQAAINCAFDTYYWVNWPTADNPWMHPANWWQSYVAVIVGYPSPAKGGEWVGGLKPRFIDYKTVTFTKDTPKFRGIDLVWYGPFKAGDTAKIPADDADFWVRKGYATYAG